MKPPTPTPTPSEMARVLATTVDGPHDPETTLALVEVAAQALRALAYATRGDAGVGDPGCVHDVLGTLSAATRTLAQVLTQLRRYLDRAENAGRLTVDEYGYRTALVVEQSRDRLAAASAATVTLAEWVMAAQSAVSSLRSTAGDAP